MTYATVMVGLALDQSNEARLEVAGQMAERFEAGIIGVAAAQFGPPLYFTDGAAGAESDRSGGGRGQEAAARAGGAIPRGDAKPRRPKWSGAAPMDFPRAISCWRRLDAADIIVGRRGRPRRFSDPFALAIPRTW